MTDIPFHLRDALPRDLPIEKIEDCLHLSRSLESLLGDTLLLRVAGEWRVYVRSGMLDPFARVALGPAGIAFRRDLVGSVLDVADSAGTIHSLPLSLEIESRSETLAFSPAVKVDPALVPARDEAPAAVASREPAWLVEVRARVARGKMIEAIKALREATGLGLREAKEAVDAIHAGRDPLLPMHEARAESSIHQGAWLDEVRALLARGEKIAAIKRYRLATGAGLKEAKEAVEAMEGGHP